MVANARRSRNSGVRACTTALAKSAQASGSAPPREPILGSASHVSGRGYVCHDIGGNFKAESVSSRPP
jgi:hypothetical protein